MVYGFHPLQSVYTRLSSPLELDLVYIDLWGPATFLSSCNFMYNMTFVDAYYRYTWMLDLFTEIQIRSLFRVLSIQSYGSITIQHLTQSSTNRLGWGVEFRPFTKYLNVWVYHFVSSLAHIVQCVIRWIF